MTKKERIAIRNKHLKYLAGDAFVMVCAIGGVFLADPYSQFRAGKVPEFVGPENWLELFFSVLSGVGAVYGLQEFNGKKVNKGRKHEKLVKRCLTAFLLGVAARVAIG